MVTNRETGLVDSKAAAQYKRDPRAPWEKTLGTTCALRATRCIVSVRNLNSKSTARTADQKTVSSEWQQHISLSLSLSARVRARGDICNCEAQPPLGIRPKTFSADAPELPLPAPLPPLFPHRCDTLASGRAPTLSAKTSRARVGVVRLRARSSTPWAASSSG